MNPDLKSLLINLSAAAVGGCSGWLWKWWREARQRNKRLRELQQVPREDEVAICVRVGGGSDPRDDIKKYLRQALPTVKTLLLYDVATAESNLADPAVAEGIMEDIIEGLRAYAKSALTRVHFFPSGMLAYAPLVPAIMANWGRTVVYHRTSEDYVALYEINKDRIHQAGRAFPSVKTWQVISIPEQAQPEAR